MTEQQEDYLRCDSDPPVAKWEYVKNGHIKVTFADGGVAIVNPNGEEVLSA